MDGPTETKAIEAMAERIEHLEATVLSRQNEQQTESPKSLVNRIRELQKSILQLEAQCPGFASACEKYNVLREDLGVELVPTTTAQAEHKGTIESLEMKDPIKRALLLDAGPEVDQLCNSLELVDSLKDSVSSPFLETMEEDKIRLSQSEIKLASYTKLAQRYHRQVQELLARYSVAMEALSLQVVAWDEKLTDLEKQK